MFLSPLLLPNVLTVSRLYFSWFRSHGFATLPWQSGRALLVSNESESRTRHFKTPWSQSPRGRDSNRPGDSPIGASLNGSYIHPEGGHALNRACNGPVSEGPRRIENRASGANLQFKSVVMHSSHVPALLIVQTPRVLLSPPRVSEGVPWQRKKNKGVVW